MKVSDQVVILDELDRFNTWEPVICSECGSEHVEQVGCHYICLFCGYMTGCGD